jgi:hypothetical protein
LLKFGAKGGGGVLRFVLENFNFLFFQFYLKKQCFRACPGKWSEKGAYAGQAELGLRL